MKRTVLKIVCILLTLAMFAALFSVGALFAGAEPLLPWTNDDGGWFERIFNTTTTAPADSGETTTRSGGDGDNTTAPVVTETGQGTQPTDQPTTQYYEPDYEYNDNEFYEPNNSYTPAVSPTLPATLTTVPTTIPAEESSTTFNASLAALLERDSAAAFVVPTTTQPYTMRQATAPVVTTQQNTVTWQMAALIAAGVLFVVIAALLIALFIQSRRADEDHYRAMRGAKHEYRPVRPVRNEDGGIMPTERSYEPEPVRVTRYDGDVRDIDPIGTAEAIRSAAITNTLTGLDPLIRKYSERSAAERFNYDDEDLSGEDVLKATDDMMYDIERTERNRIENEERALEIMSESAEEQVACPSCGAMNPKRAMFCVDCGQYLR